MFVDGGDCGAGFIKQGYTPAQTCFVDRARNRIDESLVRETHGCPDLAAMTADVISIPRACHIPIATSTHSLYTPQMQKHKRKHKKSEMRTKKDSRMAEQGFVDADTAAALLGVSKPRAYALGASGLILARPLGGAKYFSKASVEQYLRELEVPPNWITLAEAMERTGYSRSTLYQRAKTRNIHVRKLAGRVYVVTPILGITR
jgi:predicted DNA-binding transcriptional regulator AlpA